LYPFKEITDGDVKFVNNSLCNVEDILWKGEILQDKKQKVTIENYKNLRPCKQVLNADFDHWCWILHCNTIFLTLHIVIQCFYKILALLESKKIDINNLFPCDLVVVWYCAKSPLANLNFLIVLGISDRNNCKPEKSQRWQSHVNCIINMLGTSVWVHCTLKSHIEPLIHTTSQLYNSPVNCVGELANPQKTSRVF